MQSTRVGQERGQTVFGTGEGVFRRSVSAGGGGSAESGVSSRALGAPSLSLIGRNGPSCQLLRDSEGPIVLLDACMNLKCPVNHTKVRQGRCSAICECCGKRSRAAPVDSDGAPDLFRMAQGWSTAPYPADFRHGEGSVGSTFTCPSCNKQLRKGGTLRVRSYLSAPDGRSVVAHRVRGRGASAGRSAAIVTVCPGLSVEESLRRSIRTRIAEGGWADAEYPFTGLFSVAPRGRWQRGCELPFMGCFGMLRRDASERRS